MLELFKIGFLSFTLLDLTDILIVSIAFYWLYKALKNTIAVQILFGLVILIGLSFITEAVNFKSINWILRTIADIWLIAFIVLFQPELRRLLLMITQGPIFRFFGRANISQTIDEVVFSAIEMSEKHTGALVVFTRSQNVEMSIDTGIPISAKVSKELILSVFNTKSPLHDGAIIIDNQMLVAARCVLPLSHATKYENKNLGTRHRAALGLSEQIDAIILIVSEETGSISIAQSGKLTLDIKKEELLRVLNNKLSTKKTDLMEDYTTLIDNSNKEQRLHLVEEIKRKGITDPEVLAAIAFVPREYFVHPSFINRSYEDTALPIDCNQTISQPYTVAYMTQLLNVKEGTKVLEIGTGSGYQATILKVLGAKVFSIERIPELYHYLLTLFGNLKLNVNLKLGDGTLGWKQYAPYKGIIVTAAAPFIPHSLEEQLAVGGRLVIPVGDKDGQIMHLVERVDHKTFRDTQLDDFKFVPLIGKQGWSE